ncbi:CDP-alcohol phosphatidyltransferase family protein [Parapedobacter sp. DT-150]|uniref:CDP-alcohol phosphatidyltransferase family protein n=1 Tax=Parapedobacter sp. DT-150 TaxID=3396162 RepID=UPI003F1DF6D8
MHSTSYYIVNGITFYRLIAAPVLLLLIFTGQRDIFKWLLAFSFFTDAIDGYLARKYKAVSVMGARLDSIADDLTVLVAIIGLFAWHWSFIRQEYLWILLLLLLFVVQLVFALIRYGKTTSFHTYLAKAAAVFQGLFLVFTFFLPSPPLLLFYVAMVLTALDIIEETVMVILLPTWEADVSGLYQLLKRRSV